MIKRHYIAGSWLRPKRTDVFTKCMISMIAAFAARETMCGVTDDTTGGNVWGSRF